jgi:hypothetical protein
MTRAKAVRHSAGGATADALNLAIQLRLASQLTFGSRRALVVVEAGFSHAARLRRAASVNESHPLRNQNSSIKMPFREAGLDRLD